MYAPGLPDKHIYGDVKKLKPGQLYDYVIQQHDAKKRGTHYDLRIGNKDLGMFSWALPALPHEDSRRIWAPQTELHSHDYNTFEGEIPSGYGAGKVQKLQSGEVLVTDKNDDKISFSIADKKHPKRYTLLNPGGLGHGKVWMVIKDREPEVTGAEKIHYKTIETKDLEKKLKTLAPGWNAQVKLDGALNFLSVDPRGKIEMVSHRISKQTGKPVLHTERFFGEIPHMRDAPKHIRDSIISTEVHAVKDGKPLPVQELGGILNSTTAKALKKMQAEKIDLKGLLFDITRFNGQELDTSVPYEARRKALMEVIKYLPKNKFVLPRMYDDVDGTMKLIKNIQEGKEPQSLEGIVVHPRVGTPYKAKIRPESDVYITGTFPAEKGSKYENKGIGGFTYSLTPHGATVGKIGTGLSDVLRRQAHESPESFKGRVANIASHGQFEKTKAHRVAALLRISEDYSADQPPPHHS
jgi:hypothetical protein